MNFKNHIKIYKEGKSMRFARGLSEKLKKNFSTFKLFNSSTRVCAVMVALCAFFAATAQARFSATPIPLTEGTDADL